MTSDSTSVDIVHAFWEQVWNAHAPEAVDRFVDEDFILVNAGTEICGREKFKAWIRDFIEHVPDLHLSVLESFQNSDGTRVASRWLITGRNNGILGSAPDQMAIEFTGTAVWAVDGNGTLTHNWVERASWELHQRLIGRD